MRDKKFRAWHKKYKDMYTIQDLHMATITNGGIWATVEARNCIGQKDIYIQIQPKDIKVMQYTGLKDKNGVEIYEGDIVKSVFTKLNGEKREEIRLVAWDECNPCFVLETIPVKAGWGEYDFIQCGARENEVIGNTYENSELLTKLKQ